MGQRSYYSRFIVTINMGIIITNFICFKLRFYFLILKLSCENEKKEGVDARRVSFPRWSVGTREEELDENHFNCLNKFMWSENSAVKVLTYRLLNFLGYQDLIDMMYLEKNKLNWAKAGISNEEKLIY